MKAPAWGLLGPDAIESERRTRTLGLGGAVREFNDLAVPGMGGVWFGKQLLLATLGVVVAEAIRETGAALKNIQCANAIEALGCVLAFNRTQWAFDARLSGRTKLNGKKDLSFTNVVKPSFYVTQPMRMTTVQPLPALGLVDATGERFNSFAASDIGRTFVSLATENGYNDGPVKKSVIALLTRWAMGTLTGIAGSVELQAVLSPNLPLSEAGREFLREQLQSGAEENDRRRTTALAWMEMLRSRATSDDNARRAISWASKPAMLSDGHWQDMHAGALFFNLRDAAIVLLDRLEALIAYRPGQCIDADDTALLALAKPLAEVRDRSKRFLTPKHDPSPDKMATTFAMECSTASDADLFQHLVRRDGKVLRLREQTIVAGDAFKGMVLPEQADDADEERKDSVRLTKRIGLPKGISRRMANLFLLNLDLHAELSSWLADNPTTSGAN